MIKLLHIAENKPSPRIWTEEFCKQLGAIGELTIIEDGKKMSQAQLADQIRQCNIFITCWGAIAIPPSIAVDRGELEYISCVSGSVKGLVPPEIVEAGIPVTNWGDAPATRLAEGAFYLLLGCLKGMSVRLRVIRDGRWAAPIDSPCYGTLEHLNVGIFGCGAIGRRFVEMLQPFGPIIRIFDPYAIDLPEDCIVVDTLSELFSKSEAVVIHAALTDQTRKSVTAELLAILPRNGIVVNVARGAIIDQDALFAELESGRLRAGLDVLDPDVLAPDHEARQWDNLILTGHSIGRACHLDGSEYQFDMMHQYCIENVKRHIAGKPLRFIMDSDRYLHST